MKHRSMRGVFGSVGLGLVVTVASTTLSWGVTLPTIPEPTPTAGPTAGGTEVTATLPQGWLQVSNSHNSHNIVGLAADGSVWAWGDNQFLILGTGASASATTAVPLPVALPAGLTFTAIAANTTAMALASNGDIYTWGSGTSGSLGNNTINSWAATPVLATRPTGVTWTAIDSYSGVMLALDQNGHIWSWGDQLYGRLGNGYGGNLRVPTMIDVPGVVFTSMSVGGHSAHAIDSTGQVWSWGEGSLCLGAGSGRRTPTPVTLPAGVTAKAVVAGDLNMYILATDGTIWGCGDNAMGELGTGTFTGPGGVGTTYDTLIQVSPPGVTFTSVNPLYETTFAIASDGTVWGWGINSSRQLGPSVTDLKVATPTIVQLPAGLDVVDIQGGSGNAAFLTSNGELWVSGSNNLGLFGDGTTMPAPAGPVAVPTKALTPGGLAWEVDFGGVAGLNLAQTGEKWTVDTPPGCGVVDVDVYYDFGFLYNGVWYGTTDYQLDYPLHFTYGSPAVIVTRPASATVAPGGTFTTSVGVKGDDKPTIQWQSSTDGVTWTNIPGATGTTLTVTNVTADTQFQVVVANCWTSLVAPASVKVSLTSGTGGAPAGWAPWPLAAMTGMLLGGWLLLRRRAAALAG